MAGVRISRDVADLAQRLGHTPLDIIGPSRKGLYRFTCGCGHSSASRQTRALAFEALALHLVKVTGATLINGASLPRSVGADL